MAQITTNEIDFVDYYIRANSCNLWLLNFLCLNQFIEYTDDTDMTDFCRY